MRRFRLGMRWWLALAFALIAALTSLVVAGNALHSSSQSLRSHAQVLAIGNSVGASTELTAAIDKGTLNQAIKKISTTRRLSLFAFDRSGSPVTSPKSYGVQLQNIPSRLVAVSTAIGGERYIHSAPDGSSTLVALPLRRHGVFAVLAYSPRPDVATELDIVKRTILESALIAVLIGAAAGHPRRDPDRAAAASHRRRCPGDRRGRLRRAAQAAVPRRARRARRDDRPHAPATARDVRAARPRSTTGSRTCSSACTRASCCRPRSLGRLRERLGAPDPRGRLALAGRSAARPVARAVAADARGRPVPQRRDRVRGARDTRSRAHLQRRSASRSSRASTRPCSCSPTSPSASAARAPSASSSRTRRTSCGRRSPRSAARSRCCSRARRTTRSSATGSSGTSSASARA